MTFVCFCRVRKRSTEMTKILVIISTPIPTHITIDYKGYIVDISE